MIFPCGSLTGFGFVYQMRNDVFGSHFVDTGEVGAIDAPELIACGSCENIYATVLQTLSMRDSWTI